MSLFERVPGKGRYFKNTLTGEIVTRRQADKYMRAGLSNEASVKMSQVTNLDLYLSRPARGRKSILKKEGVEKEIILEARKEELKRKKEIVAEQKELKAIERQVRKQHLKKVRRTKIRKELLKGGAKGARVNFNTYAEYLTSLKEAKAMGLLRGYGLGMVGFDEKTGDPRAVTVFGMISMVDPPIPEEIFNERFDEERNARLYFVFQHYFMHLAFKKEFYEQVNKEWIEAGRPPHSNYRRKRKAGTKRKVGGKRK